jgi:hypothetical protein
MNNENQNENPVTQPQVPTYTQHPGGLKQANPTKKIMIAFVAGVVFSATVIGVILLATGKVSLGKKATVTPNSSQTNNSGSQLPGKEKVTEEELLNYKEPKDCTTLNTYAIYKLSISRKIMKSIDLEGSVLTLGDSSTTQYSRWTKLPKVVDSDCSDLKITDIEAGDILNIYTDKFTPTGQSANTQLIQKVN